jgi:hypothetical protein
MANFMSSWDFRLPRSGETVCVVDEGATGTSRCLQYGAVLIKQAFGDSVTYLVMGYGEL